VLFGECVHARAGGKVVRRLGATVQHDDQRERLPTITAGNVELVGAASSSVAIQPRHELSAVRHDIGLARRRRMGHSADARRGAEPFDPIEEATQRPGHVRPGRSFPAGRPQAGVRPPESLSGARRRPRICHLHLLCHHVDDMRYPIRRCISGFPDAVGRGVPRRLASKHPLQKRSRFGELACAGKTGRLEHVDVSVVRLQSFLTLETGQASSRGGLIRLPVGIAYAD
jgi:hypothetical protein